MITAIALVLVVAPADGTVETNDAESGRTATVPAIEKIADESAVKELTGKIRVLGSAPRPTVTLKGKENETRLSGDLTRELQRLASFQVRVVGRTNGSVFELKEYAIVDIGGGAKPLVGMLLKNDEGEFGLRDGDKDALPLSLRPSSKRRLSRYNGAKVWVYGEQLPSGEYKVKRYGVLREAKRAAPPRDVEDDAN